MYVVCLSFVLTNEHKPKVVHEVQFDCGILLIMRRGTVHLSQLPMLGATAIDTFWDWCGSVGVTSKHLSIEPSAQPSCRQGLFVRESVNAGAVIAAVPFHACLNRELLCNSQVASAIPPLWMIAKLLRCLRLDPNAAEHVWMTVAVAAMRRGMLGTDNQNFGFYLNSAVQPVVTVEIERQRVAALLVDDASQRDYEKICSEIERCMKGTSELLRRFFGSERMRRRNKVSRDTTKEMLIQVADVERLVEAHHCVASRCIDVPVGRVVSAPYDLPTLMENEPSTATLPTLVPIVDCIHAATAEKPANCTIFTTFASASKKVGGTTGATKLQRRRVVVCASAPLKEGDELLLDWDLSDKAAAAYRHGFVDVA